MKKALSATTSVPRRREWGDIVLAVYFLAGGIFLLIVPWTKWWERNLFLYLIPFLRMVFLHTFFRGAVSILGLILLTMGIVEAMRLYSPAKP
ncbi:hypothetical protein CEE39_10330 [bacterium (candidate division B38) B3_B38]|nr:MAG: hypothetical protein CEE39_10330 [bacterium (candidate division B38) B3_B38]